MRWHRALENKHSFDHTETMETQLIVILLPLFCLSLYTRCQPEGSRNRCFHHCQKYYKLC